MHSLMIILFYVLLSITFMALHAPPAEAETLNVTLDNAAAVERRAWPVTAGVPLARGRLQDAAQTRLLDTAGREMPLQTRVLTRWNDGSVKWLLLDFQANVGPNAKATYTLHHGAGVSPQKVTGVSVRETPDEVAVDTGALRFRVSKKRFAFLTDVAVKEGNHWRRLVTPDAQADAFLELEHQTPGPPEEENWLRRAAGAPRDRFVASADKQVRVRVEENGQLRVTLRIDAWHENAEGRRFAPMTLRLSAFKDSPLLRVLHTFVYTGDPKQDFLRTLGLTLPLAGKNVTAAFGTGPSVNAAAGEPVAPGTWESLYTIGPDKFYHDVPYTTDKTVYWTRARGGNKTEQIAQGKEAPGWVSLRTDAGAFALAVRDFWRQHPKELRVDGDGRLTLFLWPDQGDRVLDLRRRYDHVDNEVHYDLSMWKYGGQGIAKTHEFWMDWGQGGTAAEDTARAARLSACVDEPLYALPRPEQVRDSGVFGALHPRDPERFPRLEALQDLVIAWIRRNQEAFHWDGMIDYGDTFFRSFGTATHRLKVGPNAWGSRGYIGWLNDDSGLCHSLFLQALRSGDRRIFKMAELMTRHVMDIDVCHWCPQEPRQVGGGHRHDQQHWGNIITGYGTATQGVIDFYLLLGDERARDVARETAEYHLDPTQEDEDMIGGLIRAWEITGEERYRAGARAWLDKELTPRASSGNNRNNAGWPFATGRHFRMISHTSTSLLLYRTVVADPRLDKAIVEAMRSVKTPMLSTWRQKGYLPMILGAQAHEITGDQEFLDIGRAMVHHLNIPPSLDAKTRWPQGLDALSFEQLITLTRSPDVQRIYFEPLDNIYHANIMGLCALPYLMDRFARAGLRESDFDSVPLVDDPATPFEEVLNNAAFVPDNAYIYHSEKPTYLYRYTLKNQAPSDRQRTGSTLRLFENGKELGPARSDPAEIREKGKGRWSHTGPRAISFSTSDNSDPRTNGRTYTVRQE